MKDNNEHYHRWLEHRRRVAVPDDFSKRVMERVAHRAPVAQTPPHDINIPERLYHPLVRWGMASGLVLLGLFRILYVTASLLRANPVMP